MRFTLYTLWKGKGKRKTARRYVSNIDDWPCWVHLSGSLPLLFSLY